LGMALDEPRDEDEVIDDKGTKFVVEKTLWEQAKPINIDFISTPHGEGFKLTSSLAAQGGGGCGSCSC